MHTGCLNSWSGYSTLDGVTQTSHHEGLHEDSIIRCTKEGPTRNKQEALYVNGALGADLGVTAEYAVYAGSSQVSLKSEHLIKHVNAGPRNARA